MSTVRQAVVTVDVCTGWTAPDAPRELDAPAVADAPRIADWLRGLDAAGRDGRLGLHGRAVTQHVAGEPVAIIDEAGDWLQIIAPWQPSDQDPRGYPSWVRRSHVAETTPGGDKALAPPSASGVARDRRAIVEAARAHLGLTYLWAGTTPYGLDCSGLVHLSYRRAGVVVPRDAHEQATAATPVPLGDEQPGDLYFFARADGYVFHIGFVTGERTMLHAPETGRHIEDVPLAPERLTTLVGAGRFLT